MPSPVGPGSPREPRRHVGDAVEVDVVQHHQLVVARGDHVLFEVVRAHRVGQRLGRQRVFGQVARCPAMGSDGEFPHVIRAVLDRTLHQLADVPELLQRDQDSVGGQVWAELLRVDIDLRPFRRLVRVVDSGESLDDARPRLRIQALAVA